ncbi:hypothetical protein BH762_gp083 [Gordonia phage OneUp]|uniref:Uncharacterized protein n=1 Tax=Gordonia phage OneUp TaxID=1838074 RepID=A0A160DES3_9CAUD|nr:hypothetical protein BH762_gp083 [Gordonia phage OneUp]ANA86436.1 hypothetical protein PBI_ONEUP_102 [Gordonia phage OneUp]
MAEPQKYRKSPVVIEAMELTGSTFYDVLAWCGGDVWTTDSEIEIQTLEGNMVASLGDFVIRGVAGEFYPCKPDIFRQTYEPASDDPGLDEAHRVMNAASVILDALASEQEKNIETITDVFPNMDPQPRRLDYRSEAWTAARALLAAGMLAKRERSV